MNNILMDVSNDIITSLNERFSSFIDKDFDFPKIEKSNCYGFFPYRNGLLTKEILTAPVNGILILGQDFGTAKYLSDIEGEDELDQTTCRNLINILPPDFKSQVFLSNVFVGLRTSGEITGINKLYKERNADYLKRCKDSVLQQITTLNPKLIIALGHYPFKFFKKELLNESFKWQGFKTYKKEIEADNCKIKIGGIETKLLCIPHPSFFFSNQARTGFDIAFFQKKVKSLTQE